MGFDPYDESPVKVRGEEYIYNQAGERGYVGDGGGAGTPYTEYGGRYGPPSPSPEPWLLRNQSSPSPVPPSSPMSPYQ